MLAIVGTVPAADFPLSHGTLAYTPAGLTLNDDHLEVQRGTPALMAAASCACEALGLGSPYGFLVGDIGHGKGSRMLYQYLAEHIAEFACKTMVFHYLQPIAHWHKRVLDAIDALPSRPRLIADAGFMYAAKMGGQAVAYDLFTPDIGELAFLADENAPHPLYTRGFILHESARAPELIARAYAHRNAAKHLFVKGQTDYVADQGGIIAAIDEPSEPAMEAIGGTGDTVTGIVAALIQAGYAVPEACAVAARANRQAGRLARPNPATSVKEIILHIPAALEEALLEKGE
ncbi:MAG: NAD(P)H-hydrate dehydratase [Syntrophaceae bacterium]